MKKFLLPKALLLILSLISYTVFSQNVGIGTTSPNHKLHVHNGHATFSHGFGLMINYDASAVYGYVPYQTGVKSMAGIGPNCGYDFGTIIHSDALIGLRETDNDKLSGWFDVNDNNFIWNGLISAKRVKVQTDVWADYVFQKDYQLKSLEEVDSYILENGHLPNIPSAEEMIDKGIDVSEMNVKFMEKIEELYLHSIQMNKEIQALKAKNLELEEKLKQR